MSMDVSSEIVHLLQPFKRTREALDTVVSFVPGQTCVASEA